MQKSKDNDKKFKFKIKVHIKQRMILMYLICVFIPLLFGGFFLRNHLREVMEVQMKNTQKNELTIQRKNIENSFNRLIKISAIAANKLESLKIKDKTNDLQTALKELQNEYSDTISGMYLYSLEENEVNTDYYSLSGNIIGTENTLAFTEEVLNEKSYNQLIQKTDKVEFMTIFGRNGKEYLCLVKGIEIEGIKTFYIARININVYTPEKRMEIIQNGFALDGHIIAYQNFSQEVNVSDNQLKDFIKDRVTYYNFQDDGEDYILIALSSAIAKTGNRLTVYSILPYQSVKNAVAIGTYDKIIYFVVPLLSSFIIIILFSINFSKRLNAFKHHIHKAASGDLTVTAPKKGSDEIYELYEDLQLMISSIERLITTIYESQVQKEKLNSRQKEVEFKMLASQINPHFLYNTLETIRMKARNNGQKDIEELVKMLAKIMRRNIQASDTSVTLKSEIDLVEYYLKIQQYRFGDRVKFHIHLFCDIDNLKIMPLIIQPIVENAFVHGLETKEGDGEIRIEVRRTSNRIQIYVIDDGVGMSKEKLTEIKESLTDFSRLNRSNIGLRNVDQRIKLLYGEDYGLWIDSIENKGTTVIIDLPDDMN